VTVTELCCQYLADAESGQTPGARRTTEKPLTLACDRGRIEGHIVPLLGRLAVATVTKQDVERFMHAVGAGETARQHTSKMRGTSRVTSGLPADVTPHVLRHSFASLANDLGYSEPTIGMLIGHAGHSVTGGYIHGADAVLLAAAELRCTQRD
jgi:integrase